MLSNMTGTDYGAEFVSPVTLSSDWSRVARLLLLSSMSAIGSIGNVFMISAVMIEDYLRKRGNAFVVNVALADLLVSGLLVPASAVMILADLPETLTVCKFHWFLAALCFLVTVLSIAAIAVENYIRLCCTPRVYEVLTPCRITTILLTIWTVCAITSGLQFTSDLSFDYCRRKWKGLFPYQASVAVIFVLVPLTLTLFCYAKAKYKIRMVKSRPSFKPPVTFGWDYNLMLTNIYSFVLFIVFWLPFGVVLALDTTVRTVSDNVFYHIAWFAISKSCVNNILYCVTNRHFRGAYVNLFHYCCCKTTVSFSRRQRPDGTRPSGDVRVHIIPGYNMYCSPQRGREAQGKRCSGRLNGRDVYEL
ncbi:PREDICTED: melatonin receptor type 1B-A-like [Nicrophorus vespilloides]|uniref:Melatonin receptor type 1B-A-like n=1 Tax=Nicrophorus vespilloides TaxID=110193 RepID=A0ABM1N206_NICVS|nr:PREDICTED: melatonin receptor type 1B-A-like [Nicrophorus vespilloides]